MFAIAHNIRAFLLARATAALLKPRRKDAFNGYAWKKQGYDKNKTVLDVIANKLRNATTENDLYQACLDCLEWGAGGKQFKLYTANRDWLRGKKRQIELSKLLDGYFQILAVTVIRASLIIPPSSVIFGYTGIVPK